MRLPGIIAAHRLQLWLIVVASIALVVSAVLVVDLRRNTRDAVISKTGDALSQAANDLLRNVPALSEAPDAAESDAAPTRFVAERLNATSYAVLRNYQDVEGGYLIDGQLAGHTFPTHTEPGSVLLQPPFEAGLVAEALAKAKQSGQVSIVSGVEDDDRVVVAVAVGESPRLAAWTLRRFFHFDSGEETRQRLLIFATMLFAMGVLAILLWLSYSLQKEFRSIQAGLERLRADPGHRLQGPFRELTVIANAVNQMADSRQALEIELRREDRLRVMGRLVAGIVHEIRNPLNSVKLSVRLLARKLPGEPEAQERMQVVTDEIARLDRILRSLSAFRLDQDPALRRQPLHPIAERSLALIEPQTTELGIQTTLDCPRQLSVYADADLLRQALLNLLLNAVDAAGAGGTIRLAARAREDAVEIAVEDSGPGIPEEDLERIFDAFYTTKPAGSGLGLAVTHTLIEKMGASIRVENRKPGARFLIEIKEAPRVPAEERHG